MAGERRPGIEQATDLQRAVYNQRSKEIDDALEGIRSPGTAAAILKLAMEHEVLVQMLVGRGQFSEYDFMRAATMRMERWLAEQKKADEATKAVKRRKE